jgi:hypothetical protein
VDPVPQVKLIADVGGQVRLLGYDLGGMSAMPGEAFGFTLYWEAQRAMDRDWSVFCHLLDAETGLPIVTRDRYPGQGLLATSDMSAGLRWADRYVLQIPQTAYAPREALLEIGLYDINTGERPPVTVTLGPYLDVTGNALRFQPLRILAREGPYPNPVSITFEDQLRLVGWQVDRRVAVQGETIHLTLYWECVGEMHENYTVFTQIVDDRGQKWAQWDAWPAELPTSTWQVGDAFEDRYELSLDGNTPPGAKSLIMGVYRQDGAGVIERLRIINEQGRMLLRTYVVLDHVSVQERGG